MIHRDWKIGLVVGLILVIILVIKFATDPGLSPEARMLQANNASDNRDNADINETEIFAVNVNQDIPNKISLDTEQIDPPVSESQNDTVSNAVSFTGHVSLDDLREVPGLAEESESAAINTNMQISEQKPQTDSETDISNSESELVPFDYESAEPIKTERFYIVGKNQTLSEISRLFYGSANKWQRIVDANPDLIKDPNKIKAGMKLIIPR